MRRKHEARCDVRWPWLVGALLWGGCGAALDLAADPAAGGARGPCAPGALPLDHAQCGTPVQASGAPQATPPAAGPRVVIDDPAGTPLPTDTACPTTALTAVPFAPSPEETDTALANETRPEVLCAAYEHRPEDDRSTRTATNQLDSARALLERTRAEAARFNALPNVDPDLGPMEAARLTQQLRNLEGQVRAATAQLQQAACARQDADAQLAQCRAFAQRRLAQREAAAAARPLTEIQALPPAQRTPAEVARVADADRAATSAIRCDALRDWWAVRAHHRAQVGLTTDAEPRCREMPACGRVCGADAATVRRENARAARRLREIRAEFDRDRGGTPRAAVVEIPRQRCVNIAGRGRVCAEVTQETEIAIPRAVAPEQYPARYMCQALEGVRAGLQRSIEYDTMPPNQRAELRQRSAVLAQEIEICQAEATGVMGLGGPTP